MTLISENFCYAINYNDVNPVLFLEDATDCLQCDDNLSYLCGSADKYSVYRKKVEQNATYLTCATNGLLNNPELHLVRENKDVTLQSKSELLYLYTSFCPYNFWVI